MAMPVERRLFREAMSRLGAAVNIVTLANTSGRHGFTASAVCSVTDDPPTLLVCVHRESRSRVVIEPGVAICINTLASHQRALSADFAGASDMAERFRSGNWESLTTGAPVLGEALVACDCRVVNIVEIGTHSVVFCEVEAVHLGQAGDGLIYYARSYQAVSPPL